METRMNTRSSLANNDDNTNNNASGLANILSQIVAKPNARRANDGEGSSNLATEEYCRKDKVQKLEYEFWHHQMLGTEVDKYTARFHKLAKMVLHMVSTEEKRIYQYIWGLIPKIRRNVTSSNPITLQAVVGLAYHLTKDVVRSGGAPKGEDGGWKRQDNHQRNHG
ncbi:hypothetical protein Tco_1067244 [Tanacetum coccineum]|uniref:Reverse transcriptase domain-containing protein n=1 Tax=Tanacetum coccineum TaxID=301880 RepID=A0ABQ5HDY8_9ASTR